jgi:hypothetical protein
MSEKTYHTAPTCDRLDLCRIYLLTDTEDEFNSWLVVCDALEAMASLENTVQPKIFNKANSVTLTTTPEYASVKNARVGPSVL